MLAVSALTWLVGLLALAAGAWLLFGSRPPRGRDARGYRRPSRWLGRLQIVLVAGAVVLLALASTRFRFLRAASSSATVILVMDVSESMSRTDVEPSRLDAATEAARTFLDGLPTDIRGRTGDVRGRGRRARRTDVATPGRAGGARRPPEG